MQRELTRYRQILVVGGQTGFATVRKLMYALVRAVAQAPRLTAFGVEPAQGDLTASASLRRVCDGVAVVVCTANAAPPNLQGSGVASSQPRRPQQG